VTSGASDLERHLVAQARELSVAKGFFWHRLRSDYALDAIERHAAGARTVLDVGAGAGVFGEHLRARLPGVRYAFAEPLAPLAADLGARFGSSADWTARGDWRDADAAVLLDVLEHQADDAGFLRDLVAKLRPGSLLVVTCPALEALWSAWDVRLGHFRRYRLRALRRLLALSGLELVDSRYLFQAMVLPGLLRRLHEPSGAEFPEISAALNGALYRLGLVERALAGRVPFGSSVAAVGRVRG
jgi:SAM-dependent methyltransferase